MIGLSGFTFNGLHCEGDFDLLWAEDASKGRTFTPAKTTNEYQIAGMSGTVRFPGETWGTMKRTGTLYPLIAPGSDAAAQLKMRDVCRWLLSGRGQLVFDYEPDKYYLAEFTAETKWTTKDWPDGGLQVSFVAQPFAYSRYQTVVEKTVTGAAEIPFRLATGHPAPLEAVITNTGAAAINGVVLQAGGSAWRFTRELGLPKGAELRVSCEPPVSATVVIDGVEANGFPFAEAFEQIELEQDGTVSVRLTNKGGATCSATIKLMARGRW